MQSFIDNILKAEMVDYLGYLKHEKANKPNKRNGYSKKTVRSDSDTFESLALVTPSVKVNELVLSQEVYYLNNYQTKREVLCAELIKSSS